MTGAGDDQGGRLDHLLRRYGGDPDVVWLVEKVEPRNSRVRRRDHAVRSALALFSGRPSIAARALSVALTAYERGLWRDEQHLAVLPETVTERHRLLHAILRLNGGKPLGWQTIYNIIK